MNTDKSKNRPSKALWITRTAVMTAALIAMQAATSALGNTLITGSVVNFILVVTVMTCGLLSGLTVAMLSPVFAKLLSIGPLWSLIPFIVLGNMALVALWHFIGNRSFGGKPVIGYGVSMLVAAVAKFAVLYFGIVKLAIPFLLNLPAPKAGVISGMFSVPQLITALIGGAAAMIALPVLKKAIK